ncbi:GNAT family N-acetyltransferase [Geobacillus thermoleovorans]|uniref:GNAT family N-acetyltransferase n=1 Tax=Geobacillus thermoleovorans TaxID=33941 RepID=UPI003D1E7697
MVNLFRKSFEAFELKWDTEYFLVPSARVILKDNVLTDEYKEIEEFSRQFEFVTITNADNKSKNNYWLTKKLGAFLTDINVQFVKCISNVSFDIDNISDVYEAHPYNQKILDIARNAFKYSRFFNDPFLPSDKAKNIYVHWVEGAFGKLGRYFVTVKIQKEIAGFLLFSIDEKKEYATIELIAVDPTFRGAKIGKSLVVGMESFLNKKGVSFVKVGTQIDNLAAIRFYTNFGFKYTSCNSIYHYWPHK